MLRNNKIFYAFLITILLSCICSIFNDGPWIIVILWIFFFGNYAYPFYRDVIKKEKDNKKHLEELKQTQAYEDFMKWKQTDEAKELQQQLNIVYGDYYRNKSMQDFVKRKRKNWFW